MAAAALAAGIVGGIAHAAQTPRPADSGAGRVSVPASQFQIDPGTSIQAAVDKHPGATTFYLKAGVHRRQTVTPRTGNRFIGEPGAVLDGEGVTEHAFETLRTHPANVIISGLEIRNYVPPPQRGAIQGDNGADWVVAGNAIHDNANDGLRPGPRAHVLRNRVYRNGKIGIAAYRANGMLLEGNEVYENNLSKAAESGATAEASGIKFVGCANATLRANYVHHNYAKGIWSDTNFPTVVIEDNLVTDNTMAGIWHEVSYAAVIRNNTVERNGGTSATRWLERAGINVTNSSNVEVYGNRVFDNANGIGVMYASGYPTTGPYGSHIVENLSVHDNTIRMKAGRTGLATNTGDTSIYTSRNNHFERNAYSLGRNAAWFLWTERELTAEQWQAAGNDVSGTFTSASGS